MRNSIIFIILHPNFINDFKITAFHPVTPFDMNNSPFDVIYSLISIIFLDFLLILSLKYLNFLLSYLVLFQYYLSLSKKLVLIFPYFSCYLYRLIFRFCSLSFSDSILILISLTFFCIVSMLSLLKKE